MNQGMSQGTFLLTHFFDKKKRDKKDRPLSHIRFHSLRENDILFAYE